jgi:hypothetical protein
MAQQLAAFYDKAKTLGGMKAQMRLAMISQIPSSKAASEPDSQESIQKFKQAMLEIEKEFK